MQQVLHYSAVRPASPGSTSVTSVAFADLSADPRHAALAQA
jgi:hypothetical protein